MDPPIPNYIALSFDTEQPGSFNNNDGCLCMKQY